VLPASAGPATNSTIKTIANILFQPFISSLSCRIYLPRAQQSTPEQSSTNQRQVKWISEKATSLPPAELLLLISIQFHKKNQIKLKTKSSREFKFSLQKPHQKNPVVSATSSHVRIQTKKWFRKISKTCSCTTFWATPKHKQEQGTCRKCLPTCCRYPAPKFNLNSRLQMQ
jgi:hypothetical protein